MVLKGPSEIFNLLVNPANGYFHKFDYIFQIVQILRAGQNGTLRLQLFGCLDIKGKHLCACGFMAEKVEILQIGLVLQAAE